MKFSVSDMISVLCDLALQFAAREDVGHARRCIVKAWLLTQYFKSPQKKEAAMDFVEEFGEKIGI